MSTPVAARTYNQSHIARKHDGRPKDQHLLDVELSVGVAT